MRGVAISLRHVLKNTSRCCLFFSLFVCPAWETINCFPEPLGSSNSALQRC